MPDRRTLDRLLSGRNRLSVTEKEAMLNVLLRPVKTRWLARWRLPLAGVCAAAALASALLLVVPASEFVARGTAAVNVHVSCGHQSTCHRGDKMDFEVTPTAALRYFAAFGETADGEVIWYLPNTIEVSKAGWLDRAVISDHLGVTTLKAIFSATPLQQSDVLALLANGDPAPSPSLVVVTHRFEVVQ